VRTQFRVIMQYVRARPHTFTMTEIPMWETGTCFISKYIAIETFYET